MLKKENFSVEHIEYLRATSKRDPSLIERVLFAFGLLEALRRVELPFVFKGGTSLLLILNKPMRLSTDIDIIVEPGIDVDEYLKQAAQIFPFKAYEEQMRKGKNNMVKRHFKFQFESPRTDSTVEIVLDILFENNKYAKVEEKAIECELLLTEPRYLMVKVPDVNSILADKLTAFAPHTTGVLIGRGKDLEIMKQMYDIYTLVNEFTDFDLLYDTYMGIVADEIAYRGLDIEVEEVLRDTYNAALCIASRGQLFPEDFKSYLRGIRSLAGHIYAFDYSAEVASTYAPIIMYLCACILKGKTFERISEPEEYSSQIHNDKQVFKALKFLKKKDILAYAYSVKAEKLINS